MSPRSKREYAEAIFLRYKKASRNEKTTILNQFCTVCGYHRKHAIRPSRGFRRFTKPKAKKRGRAYHKDDNAHVEQKNWTHVREWLGYERFADQRIVVLLNEPYTTEWRLFHNFFCPSMKHITKERIGSKTLKRHDSPKTHLGAIWQLYVFYGLIVDAGMGGSYVPLVSTIARWFVKQGGIMTGVVAAGIGIGALIGPPTAN